MTTSYLEAQANGLMPVCWVMDASAKRQLDAEIADTNNPIPPGCDETQFAGVQIQVGRRSTSDLQVELISVPDEGSVRH